MDDQAASNIEYGVTPTEVMASMTGLDFVRAVFEDKLPAPPIMQTIEPFDCTAEPGVVVMYSTPGFRHSIRSARCTAAMPRRCSIR
jgi:hypothetical protein